MVRQQPPKKQVESLTHDEATRRNIPTAEHQPLMEKEDASPVRVAYERRNRDLDPQLVWRGKDVQDWSDLVVQAPPLYIQEKIHPKVLIDDLRRQSEKGGASGIQGDFFADFNGLPEGADKFDFYKYDSNWQNRMILGDSLQVMASLAEREGLRGKVQCIYIDPPYGIKFNSNFQWSTTTRSVTDGKAEHITREPEQVKAFRDTWRDGIHSYMTYLRDRLAVSRDLLTDSGSLFVQIGDENVHLVRSLLDEVFGADNFVVTFIVKKKGGTTPTDPVNDYLLWVAKSRDSLKVRPNFERRRSPGDKSKFTTLILPDGTRRSMSRLTEEQMETFGEAGAKFARVDWPLVSQDPSARSRPFMWRNVPYECAEGGHWRYDPDEQMPRLAAAGRLNLDAKRVAGIVLWDDWPYESRSNLWDDTGAQQDLVYVVQTPTKVVERCILLTTDPGDLVLDPTCGSGTTVYVAEQWGRRWITIETSRVALALTRARIMGARYNYYCLADSYEGQLKESEATGMEPSTAPTHGDVRQGFVYERVPHITLKSIAYNTEIDVIWAQYQEELEPLRLRLNDALGQTWEEWEIPRDADDAWPEGAKLLHATWWQQRIARQKEIDASIAAKAEFEHLYDKPYEDRRKVRVAGPFTVESLLPHRVLPVDEDGELMISDVKATYGDGQDFASMILENLKTAGVQQAHKEDKIAFTSLTPWPGTYVCAEGIYDESGSQKRAAIFIGPEFATVSRQDLVTAAREAGSTYLSPAPSTTTPTRPS